MKKFLEEALQKQAAYEALGMLGSVFMNGALVSLDTQPSHARAYIQKALGLGVFGLVRFEGFATCW